MVGTVRLAKRHYGFIILALSVCFGILFWFYLPMEVAGHRPGNIFMQVFYVSFMAFTLAVLLVFILFYITQRAYVDAQVATLKRFRHLLRLMVKRDFVTRYRRSVLGVLWSLLNPLLTMLVMTMVFSLLFRFEIEYFPVYLISGQLVFNMFSETTTSAMTSITSGGGAAIKKIYVPRYIFPLSKALSAIVNTGFSFIAFLLVFLFIRAPFHLTIFLIPLPILYVFIFSLGVGLTLSALAVFFRDIAYIYGVLITLVMYLTPIFYPVSILPDRVFHLIHLNPLFHYINYFRDLALYGQIPGLWANIICLGFALGALCLGLYVKITSQDRYILYL